MGNLVNPYWFSAASSAGPSVAVPILYTGTGVAQSITGVGFQPDLVIIKSRSTTTAWRWTDSTRGVTKSLDSTTFTANATEAGGVTSFDADGFTIGTDADYNTNGTTYVAFCFRKMAGAFDIVQYTGTGSAHTVAHALGAVPRFVIVKGLNVSNWRAYPGMLSSPGTKAYAFNSNNGFLTDSTSWNNTDPTSSVFTVGTHSDTDANGVTYISWLLANFTGSVAIGTYTQPAGSNGPAVNVGFQPRIVIIHITNASAPWYWFDDLRDASSPHGVYSNHFTTAAELTLATGCDMTATGFQMVTTALGGGDYLYIALR